MTCVRLITAMNLCVCGWGPLRWFALLRATTGWRPRRWLDEADQVTDRAVAGLGVEQGSALRTRCGGPRGFWSGSRLARVR